MKGTCKLCLLEKDLKQSHIIPEFMYQNVYDPNPRKFFTIKLSLDDPASSTKRIEQKGIREHMLCGECELLFSKYERYAAETIYGKNLGNKASISKASETPDQKYFLYDYKGFDYKSFKLFMMSILWRVIESKTYDVNGVDNSFKERLRKALLAEDPLAFDDFGCMLQMMFYKKHERAGGFMLSPFVTENNGHKVISVLIDGMMFSYYLDSKNIPEDRKATFLRLDGTMQIIGRVISTDPGLTDVISKAYKYFNDKIAGA
jgi:hypothetical protein